MEPVEYLKALKRRWPIVVLAVLLAVAAVLLTTPSKPPPIERTYRATNTMVLTDLTNGIQQAVGTITFNQVPLFATTGEVPQRVADALGYDGAPAALAAQVQASVDPSTGTFTVTSVQDDPDEAVTLADAFADQTIAFLAERQDAVRQARLSASLGRQRELEEQITAFDQQLATDPENQVIRAKRDATVREFSVAYEGYRSLVEVSSSLALTQLERAQAVPIETSGFQAPRSRAARLPLAAAVGLLLGVGLAFAVERFDGRLRDRRRVEQVFGSPVIAELPTLPRKRRGPELLVRPDQHSPYAEAYRTLRTSLVFLAHGAESSGPLQNQGVFVIGSPSPGDGKTTAAANLAAAFAESGQSVVLVNADFRRPRLARYVLQGTRVAPKYGLQGVGKVSAEEMLVATTIPGVRLLDLSPLAAPPGESARATARLVAALRSTVDIVLIDTPPVSVTAEALEFVPDASAVLLMCRAGRTSAASAQRTGELVRFGGAVNVAVALCDVGRPRSRRYRYYGYYTGAKPSVDVERPAGEPRRTEQVEAEDGR